MSDITFPTYEHVLIEQSGRRVRIILNRPDKLNALHSPLVNELHSVLEVLEQTGRDRVLIFTGAGEKAFIAGADIAALLDRQGAEALQAINARLMDRIALFPFPTIAQINGYCFGGGMELALACDIRLASENARFGNPEVGLNIIPAAGATHRLPAIVGRGWAREMIFSGVRLRPDVAERIGLVNRVVPLEELATEADKVADTIIQQGVEAVQLAKRVMNFEERAYKSEAATLAQAHLFASEDKHRRMRDFLDKKNK